MWDLFALAKLLLVSSDYFKSKSFLEFYKKLLSKLKFTFDFTKICCEPPVGNMN